LVRANQTLKIYGDMVNKLRRLSTKLLPMVIIQQWIYQLKYNPGIGYKKLETEWNMTQSILPHFWNIGLPIYY